MLNSTECRDRIVSNDYADLLVDYIGSDDYMKERYHSECIQGLDARTAVTYVPLQQYEDNRSMEYYSMTPNLYGLMDLGTPSSTDQMASQRMPVFDSRGAGTIVAVIDTGIDYTNKIFKNPDGSSKIVTLWDQSIQSDSFPENYYYGTEYSQEDINRALVSNDPFSVVPSRDYVGHGTFVSGVIAGSRDLEHNFSGVVPDAEIIAVKLKDPKHYIRDYFAVGAKVHCYQENDIMQGVKYAVEIAKRLNKPLSICISLGSNQGPHDNLGYFSQFLEEIGKTHGVAIMTAAGNEGVSRHHYYGNIRPNTSYETMQLHVGKGEESFSMEIWGVHYSAYSVDLQAPSGEFIPKISVKPGENKTQEVNIEGTRIILAHYSIDSKSSKHLIQMRFYHPKAGVWSFRIFGNSDLKQSFNAWLPINQFITPNTFFLKPNPDVTITSPGNALLPITVTGYDYNTKALFSHSSRGYTSSDQVSPDFAAPCVNIVGPTLAHTYEMRSGTSLAAAYATGIGAILLEWGIVCGNFNGMNCLSIKKLLVQGAKRIPNMDYPNKDWGYGMLDLFQTFSILTMDN